MSENSPSISGSAQRHHSLPHRIMEDNHGGASPSKASKPVDPVSTSTELPDRTIASRAVSKAELEALYGGAAPSPEQYKDQTKNSFHAISSFLSFSRPVATESFPAFENTPDSAVSALPQMSGNMGPPAKPRKPLPSSRPRSSTSALLEQRSANINDSIEALTPPSSPRPSTRVLVNEEENGNATSDKPRGRRRSRNVFFGGPVSSSGNSSPLENIAMETLQSGFLPENESVSRGAPPTAQSPLTNNALEILQRRFVPRDLKSGSDTTLGGSSPTRQSPPVQSPTSDTCIIDGITMNREQFEEHVRARPNPIAKILARNLEKANGQSPKSNVRERSAESRFRGSLPTPDPSSPIPTPDPSCGGASPQKPKYPVETPYDTIPALSQRSSSGLKSLLQAIHGDPDLKMMMFYTAAYAWSDTFMFPYANHPDSVNDFPDAWRYEARHGFASYKFTATAVAALFTFQQDLYTELVYMAKRRHEEDFTPRIKEIIEENEKHLGFVRLAHESDIKNEVSGKSWCYGPTTWSSPTSKGPMISCERPADFPAWRGWVGGKLAEWPDKDLPLWIRGYLLKTRDLRSRL